MNMWFRLLNSPPNRTDTCQAEQLADLLILPWSIRKMCCIATQAAYEHCLPKDNLQRGRGRYMGHLSYHRWGQVTHRVIWRSATPFHCTGKTRATRVFSVFLQCETQAWYIILQRVIRCSPHMLFQIWLVFKTLNCGVLFEYVHIWK